MISINRVLCPIDFSETSRRALEYAAIIARWYRAPLTVLYVFSSMPVMDVPPRELGPTGRERLMEDLRRFTAPPSFGLRVSLRVVEAAEIDLEINAQAASLGADLLVMGSHGRTGFKRLMLGSVTERTLRRAPCAVLVVPPAANDRLPAGPLRFRHILCPIDFSEESARACRYAMALAQENFASLTLLHAIEVPPELHDGHVADLTDIDRLHAEEAARCLRELRQMVPKDSNEFCTVCTQVEEGAADHVVLTTADARHADLIVMGVRGRGALDRAVFGSTTEAVARAARCPVLIVHAGDADSIARPAASSAVGRAVGQ